MVVLVIPMSLKPVFHKNHPGSERLWISKGFNFGHPPAPRPVFLPISAVFPSLSQLCVLEVLLRTFERSLTKPKTFSSRFFKNLQAFQKSHQLGGGIGRALAVSMADSRAHPWPSSPSTLASLVSPSGPTA